MSKTHVILRNSLGCELARVSMDYDDATTEALAQAAIDIVQSCMSLSEGDSITVES